MTTQMGRRFAPGDANHTFCTPSCSNNSNGYGDYRFDDVAGEIEEIAEGDEMAMFIGGGGSGDGKMKNRLDLIKEDEISRLALSETLVDQDMVYVAVSKSDSSMAALQWAIKSSVDLHSTTLYLIHVFPELKWVPNPLGHGKVPRSQVRKEEVDKHLEEETTKRRQLLNKFMDKCNSQKVKVETILIESDMEAKAILELISVLNIKKLVLGVSKSNLRKLRSRKGNGIPDQILQKAPEWCEIKFICEGKDAFEDHPHTPTASTNNASDHDQIPRTSSSPRPVGNNTNAEDQPSKAQHRDNPGFPYCCFKA